MPKEEVPPNMSIKYNCLKSCEESTKPVEKRKLNSRKGMIEKKPINPYSAAIKLTKNLTTIYPLEFIIGLNFGGNVYFQFEL
jgi:hypothetical protein